MRMTITVNGVPHAVDVEDRRLLCDVLREDLGLRGTNVGCAHGECGSCTVLLDGRPVRSCLMLGVQADDAAIRTIEDLAGEDGALHPLQEAFRARHAVQCGFCTPGLLMTALPAVEAGTALDDAGARELVAGNICRCTGYDGIAEAVVDAALAFAAGGGR